MERERFNALRAIFTSRRAVEWSIVAAVLISLVWALEYQMRVMRGEAEQVAVRATVSSLRVALVIEQLMEQVRAKDNVLAAPPPAATRNPFTLLQAVPPSYAGEVAQRNIFSVPPGSWVYDPECTCIGYRLMYPDGLEPAQTADAIWLRVGSDAGEPRLLPMSDYRWMGRHVN